MTHTPGPWEILETPGPWLYDPNNAYPYNIKGNDGFMPCAVFGDGTRNRGLAEANARLIAAAPELLEALTTALKGLEYAADALDAPTKSAMREDISSIRAAIDKATA